MLSLEERINTSYKTLEFIESKLDELINLIKQTNDKNKLMKILMENESWKQKLNREKLIIAGLIKEAGADISDFQ